jgi:hypothetical protein
MAGERSDDPKYWEFYCYRCEQWCERRGSWCQLYESEPRTSLCVFREHPLRANGVPWWPYTSVDDDDRRWSKYGDFYYPREPYPDAS